MIVAAGLPLDPSDRRVGAVVAQRVGDQLSDGRGVGAAEIAVRDPPATAGKRREPQRPVPRHRDRTGRIGTQVVVVGLQ